MIAEIADVGGAGDDERVQAQRGETPPEARESRGQMVGRWKAHVSTSVGWIPRLVRRDGAQRGPSSQRCVSDRTATGLPGGGNGPAEAHVALGCQDPVRSLVANRKSVARHPSALPGYGAYGAATATFTVVVPVRPALSVTVNRTT